MTADTLTISALAGEAYRWFERRERADGQHGEPFTATKDDAPEWVSDLVYTAHGEFLPEDWRYECVRQALAYIAETAAGDTDDLDDAGHEFADSHVDVYTAGRLKWLASNLNRLAYVDDAVDELGGDGLSTAERIGLGQYAELLEVFESVRQSLADRMDELNA